MAFNEEISAPSVFQSYVTPTTGILLGIVSLLLYKALSFRRPKHIPPGPPAIPVLGSLPFINYKDFNRECIRLAEKYGDVFSLYFGTR